MHDRWRQWTRSWGLYSGLVAIGIAMIFFGQRTYRAIENDLSAAAVSGRTSISTLAASTLTQDFQRLIDVGRSLATRVRFGELIAAERWQEASQIMATVPRDFAAIEQVLVIDLHGKLRATIPLDGTAVGTTFADRDWYRSVMTTAQPFVSNVEAGDGANHTNFFVAVPVMAANGELKAILALRVGTVGFLRLFAQLLLEPSGAIYVIDRHGSVAFDSANPAASPLKDWSDDPVVQRVLSGATGVAIDDTPTRRSEELHVSTYAPTLFGWGVIAQWPHSTVFAARNDELGRVSIAFALLVAMTGAAVALLIRLAVERKQTETERRVNAQLESRVLERTAQLKDINLELESFSYSISHDLRAPLRAIDGYTNLLIEENKEQLGPDAKRYIDNVHRNVVHMARLIDELLELSRVGRVALEYRHIDMHTLATEMLPAMLAEYPAVKAHVAALPPVRGDTTLIRQIWFNLIDNAAKYSSHGSTPQIEITGHVSEVEAVYCVADNGVGFDMQHYDRLFKPFSRLHSPGEFVGTGVGLAIVKRIIERHDGRIWAESVVNKGTKVFFALPCAG